jgi:DNA-binding beta-propeller fold protein YncE
MSLEPVGFVAVPPGTEPGFDHADIYGPGRRMYVAHTGADRVDILDCERRAFLRSLPGLPGVAGVLVDAEHDLLFTSDRAAARVSVFRCSDEQLLGQVDVRPHPNGLAYDRRRRQLYAFNLGEPLGEDCTVSVVDLGSMRVVRELALPGRPRWAVYDEEGDRVYANIREPAEIVVIDAETATIARAFAVPSDGPHGLWLDRGRLFCAADGGALLVLDCDSGVVVDQLPLPGVPDVVMLDAELQRLYVAIGDPGVVCAFASHPLEHLETIETETGAHTCGWDPHARCLYVFCPQSCGAILFEERPRADDALRTIDL